MDQDASDALRKLITNKEEELARDEQLIEKQRRDREDAESKSSEKLGHLSGIKARISKDLRDAQEKLRVLKEDSQAAESTVKSHEQHVETWLLLRCRAIVGGSAPGVLCALFLLGTDLRTSCERTSMPRIGRSRRLRRRKLLSRVRYGTCRCGARLSWWTENLGPKVHEEIESELV